MSTLAKIHIGKKQLRLDDDTYRALLRRVTGKTSSAAMTEPERQAVVAEMQRQGFNPASKAVGSRRKALSGPYAKKAQALWLALWNLGAVTDKRDSALLAFIARQTGIERAEWVLAAADGRAVIEALKSWAEREGVDWSTSLRHGEQIARAQYAKLNPGDLGQGAFWFSIVGAIGRSVRKEKPSDKEWIVAMNALGRELRARRQAKSKAA